MHIKINDIFYTLQGEGEHSGRACWFIRLQGCNLKCPYCDTPRSKGKVGKTMSIEQVLSLIPTSTKRVVLTGGEPLLQASACAELAEAFHKSETQVHLETNGTINPPGPIPFDWITISPKGESISGLIRFANELKFLVGIPNWEKVIKTTLDQVHSKNIRLTLMPLDEGEILTKRNLNMALNYALKHQQFQVRAQMHKMWIIP